MIVDVKICLIEHIRLSHAQNQRNHQQAWQLIFNAKILIIKNLFLMNVLIFVTKITFNQIRYYLITFFLFNTFYSPHYHISQKIQSMSIEEDFQEIAEKVDQLTLIMTELSSKASSFTVYTGATGSGKSTLTNYTHGTKLTYEKKPGEVYQIKIAGNSSYTPQIKIGNNSFQSCTQIPNICNFNGTSSADLVGWFQTRSLKQQIINGFANASVLKKGKELKIVMVCQIAMLLVSRGSMFVEIAKILSQVFREEFDKIIGSTMIVFSKVNTDQWTMQNIKDQINQIIEYNKSLSPLTFKMLSYIVENNRIGIFPTPDRITDHIQKIKSMTDSVQSTTLAYDANVSLSPQAAHLKDKFQSVLNQKSKEIKSCYLVQVNNSMVSKMRGNKVVVNQLISKFNFARNYLNNLRNQLLDTQKMKLLGQFNKGLNTSKELSEKATKNLKMILFCRRIDKKFDGLQKLIDLLNELLQQQKTKCEAENTRIYNQEQTFILQEKQRLQRLRVQEENRKRVREADQRQAKRVQEQKQKQRKQAQQRQRQRVAREQAENAERQRVRKNLQIARNNPPPVVYIHHPSSGGGRKQCQIM